MAGTPELGHSCPPATPGNTVALRHGRSWRSRAGEVSRRTGTRVSEQRLQRIDEGDEPLSGGVRCYARLVCPPPADARV